MKRDTIFYKIFQQSPTRLFELLTVLAPEQLLLYQPANPTDYTFSSVELKEFSFRIDGVFLPLTSDGWIFFVEVQMQLDDDLYERMLNEISTYIRQNKGSFSDWMAIAIYPSRTTEQKKTVVPSELFASSRFLPIYLDELGNVDDPPLGLQLMFLTIFKEDNRAIQSARELISQHRNQAKGGAIIDLVAEIMVYRFAQLSREDVEAMLDITLQETRVYQEINAEGQIKGRLATVLEQLGYKLPVIIPTELRSRVEALSLEQLSKLTKDLLAFQTLSDLKQWLDKN